MKTGTKSLLFGVHCFFIHPFFVAWAWIWLYGWPWHPLYWLAFLVHDWGYWGCEKMDDERGELHPILGARILRFFGGRDWYYFALYHSRFLAVRDGQRFSRLCVADKLAIALTPAWLYLPMARATGEIREYMAQTALNVRAGERLDERERRMIESDNQRAWYAGVRAYIRRWVDEHRDGREDLWTPKERGRTAINEEGVWR